MGAKKDSRGEIKATTFGRVRAAPPPNPKKILKPMDFSRYLWLKEKRGRESYLGVNQ